MSLETGNYRKPWFQIATKRRKTIDTQKSASKAESAKGRTTLPHHRRRRWIAFTIVGVIALAAVILVAINVGEIGAFAVQAARAKPEWLGVAALSQLATYACLSTVWARVLARVGSPQPFLMLYPLSVAKLFADQAIPSGGVSGAVFFLHALGRRGVPHRLAFSVFVFNTAAFFAAFLSATMISFAALATAEDAPPALAASIAGFAAIIMLILVVTFIIFVLRPTTLPAWTTKIPKFTQAREWLQTAARHINAERRLFFEATAIQFSIRLIDGLTVFLIFLAIGGSAPYAACFFAVVIASVAATIGPVPMGLGTFEAGMVAALKVFDAPIEDALTVTLIFRGLSLWLPLLPGFYIIQREILGKKAEQLDPRQF